MPSDQSISLAATGRARFSTVRANARLMFHISRGVPAIGSRFSQMTEIIPVTSSRRLITSATAAPGTPSSGSPNRPKINPYDSAVFTSSALVLTTSGMRTNPVERRVEDRLKVMAVGR